MPSIEKYLCIISNTGKTFLRVNVDFSQREKVFLSKFVLSYRGVLPSKEMRAPWGRNHNTLRTNTGFRLRFPSHSPDPFCQSIKLFQPLAVAETHQVHLNTCELETPGNYSDFAFLENPRDGD